MEKEILGSHTIAPGTIITDNLSHLQYRVIETTPKGLRQLQVTAISNPEEIFTNYSQIEDRFSKGSISISGYEPTDIKILYLVISDLKKKHTIKNLSQIKIHNFNVGDVVYNKHTNTVGIIRNNYKGEEYLGEVRTDSDGNVSVDDLEIYNPRKHNKALIAPDTKEEIKSYTDKFKSRVQIGKEGSPEGASRIIKRKVKQLSFN